MSGGSTITDSRLEYLIWQALKDIKPIEELSYNPTAKYFVRTQEKVLYPLIEKNDVIVVAGAFFGDEGKGKITEAIAQHPDVSTVARVNSGSNAGHTITIKGQKYIFHLVPSGILVDGVDNYIGAECVMNPINFMKKEISNLVEKGIDYKHRLYVGNVHIVTPYHILMDVIRNLGAINGLIDISKFRLLNVSTLEGISPVHASKVSKTGLRLDDLWNDETRIESILEKDMQAYHGMLMTRGIDEKLLLKICKVLNLDGHKKVPEYVLGFLRAKDKVRYLIDMYTKEVKENPLFPERRNVKHEITRKLEAGEKLLLEGPQSYWLSNSIDTHWSSSTSANTTAIGILASSGVNSIKYKICFVNVHKYPGSSRVGRGTNPAGYVPQTFYSGKRINTLDDLCKGVCTDFDTIQNQFWLSIRVNGLLEPTIYTDKTGSYLINEAMAIAEARYYGERGATTHKPRVTGLFDCVAHYVVNREQGPYLIVSAVDRGDFCNKVGVVIAYIYHHPQCKVINSDGVEYTNGMVIKPGDTYPNERVLAYCHPIIKVIDGWKDTPIATGKWTSNQNLPKGIQDFIGVVEHFTGARVIAIGNGPGNNDLIYITRK